MKRFSAKDRARFLKLLELANGSSFEGERQSALSAATRLAKAHGMTLREAAGMPDDEDQKPKHRRNYDWDGGHTRQRWRKASTRERQTFAQDTYSMAAEKRRYEEALADAYKRGLDAEERAAKHKADRIFRPVSGSGAWRSRPEFVRVLLRETSMTAKEIAETVGVSIYDVFKEKLLMRKSG